MGEWGEEWCEGEWSEKTSVRESGVKRVVEGEWGENSG